MDDDDEVTKRRLEVVLQAVGEGIITLDKEARIVHANAAASRLLGATLADLNGKGVFEAISPRRRSALAATRDDSPIWATLHDGTVQHVRGGDVFRRQDGTDLEVEYVSSPIMKGGKPSGAVIVFNATAEKARVEQALLESEERFRRLSEAAREGIVIHDNGIILDVNSAFASMLSYDASEMSGRPLLDFLAREVRQELAPRLLAGVEGLLETKGLKKGGESFPIELSTRSIPFEGRQVRVSTIRDLSDRERAADAGARATKRILQIYENMPDPFFALDREFRIMYVNPAAVSASPTLVPDKLLGQVLWDAFPEWRGSKFQAEYKRAVKERVPVVVEDFSAKLGKWFEARAYPSDEGLSVFYRDVTEARAQSAAKGTSIARPLAGKIVRDLVELGGVAHPFLQEVGRRLASDSPGMSLETIATKYREMGLGDLTLERSDEGRFTFLGHDLLERQTGSRLATCFLTLGYLSEAVSVVNRGEPTLGTEIDCQSRGSTHCRFIVQVKKPEEGLARRVRELV